MALALHERLQTWRQAWVRRRGRTAEPGATLFSGVRRRLTFWYIGVLAGALILAGAVLYFGVQQMLFRNADQNLITAARAFGGPRQGGGGPPQCPFRGPPPPELRAISVACFARDGTLVAANDTPTAFPTLSNGSLVSEAFKNRVATDTIDAGSGRGVFRRYAAMTAGPNGGQPLVVVLAISIQGEMDALHTLLIALLATGVVTLGVAMLGGLFLSARALDPVRLAFQRQQDFIADAAHELRTPLTLMRADADVLLRSRARLAEDDVALVEDIAAEARHMSALTTTMLDMARLDAGQTHLERDVVDLVAVVSETVQRTDAYARSAGVTLSYEHSGNVRTLGDRTLLTQVTLILIDNAIKYNQPGGTVAVRADRSDTHADIAITDTGIGITAADLRHLGERFYRVDKARSRETGGAGLGIAIARTIAALHGGTLTFHSIPGEGTTATLSLPAI